MSAVCWATWQASRLGLSGRVPLAAVQAAFVLTSSAKQASYSTTIFNTPWSAIRPSPSLALHTRSFQTTTRSLAKQTLSPSPEAPPSPNEGKKTSQGKTDTDSSTLTQAELNAIFGQEIDREGAADLLSTLQQRRRQGTLDEELPYPGQLIDKGLEYLRAKYPVDEDAAIIARVDRETDGDWSLPNTNPKRSRAALSILEQMRQANRASIRQDKAADVAALKEEKKMEIRRERRRAALSPVSRSKGEGKALVTRGNPSTNNSLIASEAFKNRIEQGDSWIKRSNQRVAELREAATMKYIPQMTKWQRLWPSGIFTFSAVGLALIFAYVYTPPTPKARLFYDISPATATVGTIVAINILVFFLWKVPYLWKTMNRSMIVVPAIPRAFSMLGAEFSHQQFSHLMLNITGIWFLGTQLHNDIGRGPFLALVVCGAVLPSFCSLVPPVMRKIFITATLGASGILTTFLGASCVLYEGQKVKFAYLPQEFTAWMNTAVVLAVLISIEIYQFTRSGLVPKALINSGRHHIDHVGHLAGYATGIGAAILIRQTDPYWGSIRRKSFWTWKEAHSAVPTAEMLRADTNKSSVS